MKARAASLAAILALSGASAASAADRLYTAYNIWFEQPTKVYSTNYQKGNILPAGSEVKDVKRSKDKLEFTDVTLDLRFTFEFVDRHHPGLTGEQWMARMSKKGVLPAAGYPPEVGTASTKLDSWKYWRHRFGNYLVRFSDGKVS